MIVVGLWLLFTHRTLGIMAASRVTVSPQRNLRNVFMYGIVYAIGSLSCTLPIFLVVGQPGAAGLLQPVHRLRLGYGQHPGGGDDRSRPVPGYGDPLAAKGHPLRASGQRPVHGGGWRVPGLLLGLLR